MDLKAIADTLVEACRAENETSLLENHYHPDAVSVEAADYSGMGRETKGLDGIKGKHAWWDANFEMHSSDVQGPFLHGDDRFAVIFEVDCTEKATGNRMPMKEVAIYHVADGKIVREEFFGTG
ncbi:nuclear transport factor 2 family protein [Gymnodinialimonas sp. 2305UL16-5]|uniref:nuclear transport factor 2 family protein n=1 Tax=Gymnodinialimonas mytili TaxID=3126503 RepID=UPI0030AFBC63